MSGARVWEDGSDWAGGGHWCERQGYYRITYNADHNLFSVVIESHEQGIIHDGMTSQEMSVIR